MTNYHSDKWIMEQVQRHFKEAKKMYPQEQIVGIFYQGSGNYGLDTISSDVDTKLIITPSFHNIAFNSKPVSTTHILDNNEHLDAKDARLYIQTFRKQNLNFLEILYTPYFIINPLYEEEWGKLVDKREAICRMNPVRAVAAMKGVALEKYHALKHPYPSKLAVLDKFGYDPKQLHHLLRVEDFIDRYINEEEYATCLKPINPKYLLEIKSGILPLEEAEEKAAKAIGNINRMVEDFRSYTEEREDKSIVNFLECIQYNIMRTSVEQEFYV